MVIGYLASALISWVFVIYVVFIADSNDYKNLKLLYEIDICIVVFTGIFLFVVKEKKQRVVSVICVLISGLSIVVFSALVEKSRWLNTEFKGEIESFTQAKEGHGIRYIKLTDDEERYKGSYFADDNFRVGDSVMKVKGEIEIRRRCEWPN